MRPVMMLRKTSGIAKRFVVNLRAESRLDLTHWKQIAQVILDNSWSAANAETILSSCLCQIVANGPVGPAATSVVHQLGRVVKEDDFLDLLVFQKIYLNRSDARTAIRRYKNIANLQKNWKSIRLSKHNVMWGAFHTSNPGNDPFAPLLPLNAAELECALGLPDTNPTPPYVVLRYRLANGNFSRMPTIAEAFAGGFQYYFTPRAVGCNDHGLTQPCPKQPKLPPMPEVVHFPETGANLVAIPEII